MASVVVQIKNYRTDIPGELSNDGKTWNFPVVGSLNKNGRKMRWMIYVKMFKDGGNFVKLLDTYFENGKLADNLRGWVKVDASLEGGKVRKSVPTVVEKGKNIGKSSETNVLCQALRDAYGLYNKQLKKAAAGGGGRYQPMLAKVYEPLGKVPKMPVYIQRKYNGVRAVACVEDGQCVMYSRRRLTYPGFSNIKKDLLPVLAERKGLYLDGEIYKHGVALQDISGSARRDGPENLELEYMIFDCFVPAQPGLVYSERATIVEELFGAATFRWCRRVESVKVGSVEDVDVVYRRFLKEGFEGAIVRLDVPYVYSANDYHSSAIQKIKPCLDGEFKVVGWETGSKGKAATALMVVCETAEGVKFPVTPAMELDERIMLATKMGQREDYFAEKYEGKFITVQFDEWSKGKVPQRARTRMEGRVD